MAPSHAVVTLHRLQVYSASLLLGVPAAPAAAPAGALAAASAPAGALAAASAPAGSGLPAASAPAIGPHQRYPSAAGRAGGARLGASPAAAPAPGTILTVMGVACQLPFYFRGAAHSQCVTVSPDQPGTYCLDVEGDIGRCSAGLTRQYANFSRWVDQWADNAQVRARPTLRRPLETRPRRRWVTAPGRPLRARAPAGARSDVLRCGARAQGSESRPSGECRRRSRRVPALLCACQGPSGRVRGAGALVGGSALRQGARRRRSCRATRTA